LGGANGEEKVKTVGREKSGDITRGVCTVSWRLGVPLRLRGWERRHDGQGENGCKQRLIGAGGQVTVRRPTPAPALKPDRSQGGWTRRRRPRAAERKNPQ